MTETQELLGENPKLLKETASIYAVYKPSQYHSTPSAAHPDHLDIVTWFRNNVLSLNAHAKWGDEQELGLLARLDLGTSGILLFAKNPSIHAKARAQWNKSGTTKHYIAIVEKNEITTKELLPFNKPRKIQTPIGHHPKSKRRMLAQKISGDYRVSKWLPAETHVLRCQSVNQSLETQDEQPDTTQTQALYKVDIRIMTGVRHQIRVHLASLGYPIVGDSLYSETYKKTPPNKSETINPNATQRLLLHCSEIEVLGESFYCPLPDDFKIID